MTAADAEIGNRLIRTIHSFKISNSQVSHTRVYFQPSVFNIASSARKRFQPLKLKTLLSRRTLCVRLVYGYRVTG